MKLYQPLFLFAVFFFNNCKLQEITIIQPTNNCLVKEVSFYTNYGINNGILKWDYQTQSFEYNKDGNPIKRIFYDKNRNIEYIHTMEYAKNRLTKVNNYKGKEIKIENLLFIKTYDISDDFSSLVEHIFSRTGNNNQFSETETLILDFVRNKDGELKNTKIERAKITAKPNDESSRLGIYLRLEYDGENKNLYRRWKMDPREANYEQGYGESVGYDLNGKNPWNANIWLSLIRSYDDDNSYLSEGGSWNENNLALNNYEQYYLYELNKQGFPCSVTFKRPDFTNFPFDQRIVYYNCDCIK